jgi:hypothetical protein
MNAELIKRLPLWQPPPRDISSAIWAAFWLLVLTAGEPDLLGALVGLIERIG